MAAKPYMTSDDLVASVQRKVSMPLSQSTFTYSDILAFANEEMFSTQVPAVMEFHEEYFVFYDVVPIVPGVQRYTIPTRAIGMKLRDVKWQDLNGNLFDMSRVNPEDKAFYQLNIGTSETISKYYIEGNDLVLLPALTITTSLNLFFYYFLRPNQLVSNARAATITSFINTITTINASIVPNDTVTINGVVFTAVSSSPGPNQFLIGASDIESATNLTSAINTNGIAVASNGTPSTATVTINFTSLKSSQAVSTSNSAGFLIPTSKQIIQFDQVPSSYLDPITFQTSPLYVSGATVDFLQTNPGHRTYALDVSIPTNGISGNTISFNINDVPMNIIIGDYICLSNECIIPQIPPDLHTSLAQRTASMILAAIGDQQGLQASVAKVQEMEKKQITLLDARVEGSALKIANKKSLLRFQGFGSRRRRL
jgi:hypothetical protein